MHRPALNGLDGLAPRRTLFSRVSRDGGRTFVHGATAVVYRHDATSAPGADGSLSAFDYLMSMDHFTFGHPCGVATAPDEVLAVWYAGHQTRTAIHAAKLRIQ